MEKLQTVLFSLAKATSEAWSHAGRAYNAENCTNRFASQLKYAGLAAVHPGLYSQWFDAVSEPAFMSQVAVSPRLPLKPLRVYLSSSWSAKKRVKVILDSRRFVLSQRLLCAAASSPADVRLAQLSLPHVGALDIVLHSNERFRKEGELAISLSCETLGGELAQASFAFEERARGIWLLRIGCVQGNRAGGCELTKIPAKELHGLRPKALLLFCLRELAAALELEEVFGAGDKIQAHCRKHAIHLPWVHRLSFDYDSFWLESGGKPQPDCWFSLGLETPRKAKTEIKPNKRPQYARRYALMDDLSRQVWQSLDVRPRPADMPAA